MFAIDQAHFPRLNRQTSTTGGDPPMATPEQLIQCLQRVNATMLALTQCLSEECTLEERKLILQLASQSAEQSRRIRKLFFQLYGSDPYSGNRKAYGFRAKPSPFRKNLSTAWQVCEKRLIYSNNQKEHLRQGAPKNDSAFNLPGAGGTVHSALRPTEASPDAKVPKDEKPDLPFRSGVPPESDFWRR